jgi:hypothetical protein
MAGGEAFKSWLHTSRGRVSLFGFVLGAFSISPFATYAAFAVANYTFSNLRPQLGPLISVALAFAAFIATVVLIVAPLGLAVGLVAFTLATLIRRIGGSWAAPRSRKDAGV